MAENNTIDAVEPVYIKAKDIMNNKQLNQYKMCHEVAKQIGPESLQGCQLIKGIWTIYINNQEARFKLLADMLSINNQKVQVHMENPYTTTMDTSNIKITIKDLPISYGNVPIMQFMEANNIEVCSPVQYGKIWDPETHRLTNWINGDRIVYTKEPSQPLPRWAKIDNIAVRIFHRGQPQSAKLCTNCFQTDHNKRDCKNPQVCQCCKKPGHITGDKACEAYLKAAQDNMRCVHGADDALSNFFPCEIKVFGQNFNSSEHAYQYAHAIREGQDNIANEIINSHSARQAKELSKFIKQDPKWNTTSMCEVMEQVIQAKYDQVPEFKKALLETGNSVIVESVRGAYDWGSGLDEKATVHTKKKMWPGRNLMGRLLEKLRKKQTDEKSARNRNTQKERHKRNHNTRAHKSAEPDQNEGDADSAEEYFCDTS